MPLRHIGIQAKLVATLVLAGLLPLLASLGALVFSVFHIRTDSVGQSLQAAASQEAGHLGTLLSDQAELGFLLSRLPGTSEFLRQANARPAPTTQSLAAVEAAWESLTAQDEPLRSILNNPVAAQWRAIHEQRLRFAEVMVTDAAGRLVAATNKTSDYDQSDEDWWRAASAAPGEVHFEDAVWDESAMAEEGTTGASVLDICFVLSDSQGLDGSFGARLGVMKLSISTSWLAQQIQADTLLPDYIDRMVQIIRRNGTTVGVLQPEQPSQNPDLTAAMVGRSSGWASVRGDQDLVGFAAITSRDSGLRSIHELGWWITATTSRRTALAPLYRLVWVILGAGCLTITLCFAGGLWIARREIIRPLLVLRHGVAELGAANINYRLPTAGTSVPAGAGATPPVTGEPPDHVFRRDEIGRLAEDFNRMADRLRELVRELERASLLKQQFIDVAGHELRTPVAYILGMAQLGERSVDADRPQPPPGPLLAKIVPKAKRLSRIIDNMFKLLQSGSGYAATLQLGTVDLRELIHAVARELEPFLVQRKQTLTIDAAPDLPPIEADSEKLHDVFSNLLSNAIRFSPDGGTIRIDATTAEGQWVRVAVSDAGPGIGDADLKLLFEPFYPPPRDGVMHHTSGDFAYGSRGIGLGLSVVKRFVDLHGGTVSVQTGPEGTTMLIRLPRQHSGAASAQETPDPAASI
jgi:signal transduction histidine kinase